MWPAILIIASAMASKDQELFSQCGGVLRSPHGVIATPNFPGPFPVPISCRWLIEAPSADQIVAVYLTQFYLWEGLWASEYAYFSGTDTVSLGRADLGPITPGRNVLMSTQPVLVLELRLQAPAPGNIHLRVKDHFLDVFGFNVTYQTLPRHESPRSDPCLQHLCSFTGICLASADFRKFECRCLDNHHGPACQYGPQCGPMDSPAGHICQNGGTCRYTVGSATLGCDCASGYTGPRCEHRQDGDGLLDCQNCFQACSLGECSCFGGYYLSDHRRTCFKEAKPRYEVQFQLTPGSVEPRSLEGGRLIQLRKMLEIALLSLFHEWHHLLHNLTVLAIEPGEVVRFHTYTEPDLASRLRTTLETAMRTGRLGQFFLEPDSLQIRREPAPVILGLTASPTLPVAAGSRLTLACELRPGTDSQPSVRWLRDGLPLLQDSPRRWSSVSGAARSYTALLAFEEVRALDAGVFTCEAQEWDVVQRRSLRVRVADVEPPRIHPLAVTVRRGEAASVTCLPAEPAPGPLPVGFNWLKNGRILKPSEGPEIVEDLYPSGTRILISSSQSSAVYTCLAASSAGTARADSILTVLDRQIPWCRREQHGHVEWGLAAAGTRDVQTCPADYHGLASRTCSLVHGSLARWEEPDFSGCLSSEFLAIRRKLDELELGYATTDVASVLLETRAFLKVRQYQLHAAEGEPVVDLLETVRRYQTDSVGTASNVSQVYYDIVSFLLDMPHLIQKQSHVVKLHQELLRYALGFARHHFHFVEKNALVLETQKASPRHTLKFPSRGPSWLRDSLELRLMEPAPDNESLAIAVVFYRNLSSLLPQRFYARHGRAEYQVFSKVVAVAVRGAEPGGRLHVRARLAHLGPTPPRERIRWNISCGMADFSDGIHFSAEGCLEPHPLSEDFSVCQCDRVGTYAVLLTTFTPPAASSSLPRFGAATLEVWAGIGCAVGALFVFFSGFTLLLAWRNIRGSRTAIKIQVCLALLGAFAASVKGLHEPRGPQGALLQLFVLAAACLQLCLGLTVYVDLTGLKHVTFPRVAAMGWAVPLIVVGATMVSTRALHHGPPPASVWLKVGSNNFYSFLSSVLIILMLQTWIYVMVCGELRITDTSGHTARARLKLLRRSLAIGLHLGAWVLSAILYANVPPHSGGQYIFAGASGALGLSVFLSYTICSENVRAFCGQSQPSTVLENSKLDSKLNPKSNSIQSLSKKSTGSPALLRERPAELDLIASEGGPSFELQELEESPRVSVPSRDPPWSAVDLLGGGATVVVESIPGMDSSRNITAV